MANELVSDDYDVYSAVLLQRSTMRDRERFVVREEVRATELEGTDEERRSSLVQWMVKLPGLKEETVRNYFQQNESRAVLERKLSLPLPYTLISEAERAVIWDRKDERKVRGQPLDGWKVFHEKYPRSGGVARFSRIGFNQARTQALVEFGATADWLMGHGEMVFLQKNYENEWRITKELRTWVS